MKLSAPEISTCSTCGAALEETSNGDLGCMVCLLRVGLGGEDQVEEDWLAAADDRFGIYVIERLDDGSLHELGRGAMGVTFCALDTSLQRKVALKIIKTDLAARSAEARERFMREARASAALRHENVATVYQFGVREETGQCFYAMELIEGETLEERVRRTGPLDVRTTIAIGQQVANALAAAEKRGLVHRDLKPANLMLITSEDEVRPKDRHRDHGRPLVKIIDFGLAKALKDETDPMSLTRDGFVGTPAFASPEQFSNASLDVRSDVYSLGLTLWFALTGKTPFQGRNMEEIQRAQQSGALPIQQLKAARVPSRLISLLASMLALEPASRPGTQDLAVRLQRCRRQTDGIKKTTRFALVTGLILMLAALGFFAHRSSRNDTPNPSPARPEKSIAVLPFANLSREPDSAYFADGIQDQILVRLVKIADLKVISRNSTQHYKSAPENLSQIATQLGVAKLLQGSVQKEGDVIRVAVQLIDAKSNVHLWAETYDRKLSDLFQLESDVAQHIATALEAKLTDPERRAINALATSNPEAHQAYLKGRYFWNKRTGEAYKKAEEYFDRAVALDPSYAQAYAGLGDTCQLIATADLALRREAYAKSETAIKRALELDPTLAEAHASLALLAMNYHWDWPGAELEFRRAIELNPNYATAHHWYAEYLAAVGRFDESLREIGQARQLDPVSLIINSDAGKIFFFARRNDEAMEQLNETLKMDPNFAQAHFWLGRVYAEKKRYDDAIAEFQETGRLGGTSGALAGRGYVYGMDGRRSDAEEMLAALKQLSMQRPLDSESALLVYIGLGEKDRAFASLEEQYQTRSDGLTSLRVNPNYDSLRSDPRFADLMRRVHLAP